MNSDALERLTHILQLSIAPVALISGVGLLLLSMTNRLGRVVDRARALHQRVVAAEGEPAEAKAAARDSERVEMRGETLVLWRRARFLQIAIAFIATAMFFAILMIAALFTMYLSGTALGPLVLTLFGTCLACMVVSTGFFLGDIFLSIRWLRVSIGLDP